MPSTNSRLASLYEQLNEIFLSSPQTRPTVVIIDLTDEDTPHRQAQMIELPRQQPLLLTGPPQRRTVLVTGPIQPPASLLTPIPFVQRATLLTRSSQQQASLPPPVLIDLTIDQDQPSIPVPLTPATPAAASERKRKRETSPTETEDGTPNKAAKTDNATATSETSTERVIVTDASGSENDGRSSGSAIVVDDD
jgi:hypothetical protein